RYMGHVVKNIGGIMATPKTIEQEGAIVEFVSKAKQQQAIQFLQDQLFTTPTWLIDKKLFSLTGTGDNTVGAVQSYVLRGLLNTNRLNKLMEQQMFDAAKAYTAADMLHDLSKGIFSELPAHKPIDIYRRNLQKMYVETISPLITASGPASVSIGPVTIQGPSPAADRNTDALSVLKAHVKSLAAEVKAAIPAATDTATRQHLQDLYERLDMALHPKKD
ncbi:MAG TPA: zinc-dependent metalloprotease, partial [Chitinophagaceae bacterium]|nr:zinc-dependent metalloprotease [Chitinophagaceae bacterium]